MKEEIKQIENFLEDLSLKKNVSNSTYVAYEKDLNDYVKYMNNKDIDIFKLKEEEYKEYFDILKTKIKPTSFRRKNSSIRTFYRYLWKNKLVDKIFDYSSEDLNKNLEINEILDVSNKKINYKDFIGRFEDNLYESRLKIISVLVAELNISLLNIFEIQIKDLLKYDFKKIVVKRNNKIFAYDLKENIEKILKEYYEKYAYEKRFLFSTYNSQAFRNDLKKYGYSLADLKTALVENEDSMYENIKKIYFEIGIGDE